MTAEALAIVARIGERMLACDWGRQIFHPQDVTLCPRQATGLIVLHNPTDGGEVGFQLCDEHMVIVKRETDPHQGASP